MLRDRPQNLDSHGRHYHPSCTTQNVSPFPKRSGPKSAIEERSCRGGEGASSLEEKPSSPARAPISTRVDARRELRAGARVRARATIFPAIFTQSTSRVPFSRALHSARPASPALLPASYPRPFVGSTIVGVRRSDSTRPICTHVRLPSRRRKRRRANIAARTASPPTRRTCRIYRPETLLFFILHLLYARPRISYKKIHIYICYHFQTHIFVAKL